MAIPVLVAVLGIVAAVALPAFVSARGAAQHQVCVNNMKRIDAAKRQIASERNLKEGEAVPAREVVERAEKSGRTLNSPAGGRYTVNPAGQEPVCSAHGNLSSPYDRRAMRLRPVKLNRHAESEVEK